MELNKDEGWQVGTRMVQRLRRELEPGCPNQEASQEASGHLYWPTDQGYAPPNHVWTWDFVHDTTMRGGKLHMLTVLEEYGAPEHIRSDNGSEFIEKNLREWLSREGIKSLYIEPGSPWQNGYIESFHARFREECLNREQLWTLTEARVVIGDWRWKYTSDHTGPLATSVQ